MANPVQKRKIIQISESVASDDRYASPWNLTALCDDGTVWIRSDGTGDWTKLPDIPQDVDCPEVRIVEGTL